jgi:opacity protein-like surface antigen
MVQASHWIGDRLRWDVRAVIGREKERGNTPRTTISAGAGLSWTLHRNADLELGYDYSSSRTFATGGFARSIARVGLVTRF